MHSVYAFFFFVTCGFSQCLTKTMAMNGFSLVVLTETKTLKFQSNMSILGGVGEKSSNYSKLL